METEILTDVIDIITKECNDKVEEGKNYTKYIEEMAEQSLNKAIILYATIQYDEDKLRQVHIVLEQEKTKKIQYLKENIEEILNLELELFPEELLRYIEYIIKNDGYIEYEYNYDYDNIQILTNYIITLKNLGFIFANVENNVIKIHMPKEYFKIINKKLNSKEIEIIKREKEDIIELVEGLLNAYGMISITEAYILLTKLGKDIDPEMFNKYLFFTSNILHIKFKSDQVYLYNINLLDEEIPELAELHSDFEYNFYSLEDIKLLSKNEYYVKYMQFNILKEFVKNKLDISIDKVKLELIDWYIVLAQMDYYDAEEYMSRTLEKLEIKDAYKELLKQYTREIYKICPKWKLKGGIKNKKENNIKVLKFPTK